MWQTHRHTQTEKQTDTTWQHRPRLCIASYGKNDLKTVILSVTGICTSQCVNCWWPAMFITVIQSYSDDFTKCPIRHNLSKLLLLLLINKKLSSRTETARRFVSLNILLSHSRSFEMTLLSKACVSPISIPLQLCLYVVPFLRYTASKNGVTLNPGVGVVQDHWKWELLMKYMQSLHTDLYHFFSCRLLFHMFCLFFTAIVISTGRWLWGQPKGSVKASWAVKPKNRPSRSIYT